MSRIDPSQIPGADIDLSAVRTGASGLKGNGSTIRDSGADVVRDWQQLPESFEVTGTAALYSAMVPVGSDTQLIGDSLGMIATALASYADTVEPIKARLDSLRTQASAFVAKTNSFSSKVEWISSGYTLGIPLPEKVDSWDEDPGLTDENNSLIRDVAAAEADWLDAQQQCANAIRAAVCLAPTGAADERSLASQLRSGDALQTQWGSTTDRKESCSEKAVTFQSHFLWDGVIVGFGWGTVKTLMTLGGTNPDSLWHAGQALLSGDWDGVLAAGQEDLAAMGTAWLGVAHIASAVAIPISPAERMALLNSGAMDWLPDSVKQEAENWTAGDGTALYGTVAGLVGLTLPTKWWDPKAYKADQVLQNWTDNPGGAAGLSVANIGSFFIPGVGEARGAGLAADAAKVADGARLGDLIADGSVASLKGLSADALQATIRGLSEADAARLASELAKPELDAGALSALQLDDLTLHSPVETLPSQVAVDGDRAPGPHAGDQPGTAAEPDTTPTVRDPEGSTDATDPASTADAAGPADSSAPAGAAPDSAAPAAPAGTADGAAPADAAAPAGEAAPDGAAAPAEAASPADAAADADEAAPADVDDAAVPAEAASPADHEPSVDQLPVARDTERASDVPPASHDTPSAHDSPVAHEAPAPVAHDAPAVSPTQSAPHAYEPTEIRPLATDTQFESMSVAERMQVATAEVQHGAVAYASDADALHAGRSIWQDAVERIDPWQEDAVKDYTREHPVAPDGLTYKPINAALRSADGTASTTVAHAVKEIDEVMHLRPVPETTVVTRGMDIGHWGGDPADLAGTRFTERAYVSSSLGGPAASFAEKDAILHLRVPDGTAAVWVEDVSVFGGSERELLLGRGLDWVVTRTVFFEGQWHVFGEFLRS